MGFASFFGQNVLIVETMMLTQKLWYQLMSGDNIGKEILLSSHSGFRDVEWGTNTGVICKDVDSSGLAKNIPSQLNFPQPTSLLACAICIQDFAVGDVVAFSSAPQSSGCNHIFHEKCILDWLERENSCPTCKREFAKIRMSRKKPVVIVSPRH
uniref:RING-type domain-containing protein n=1 Tax=Corethron hystrix TaxID=216773 RepID=A0A6U5E6L1_9STRA|mmetsp:Transcript_16197/g.36443  ORF Transcript_16197/g.36443 Transcript_16197/m.36443 type:complete len:154 (+) Transcript_16197:551-1012(+)